MEHHTDNHFLCTQCGSVYFSAKKNAVCPTCRAKNKPYQVKPLHCPYCGSPAYLKHKTEIFSEEKLSRMTINKSEFLYVCKNYPECDSFVWTHPRTQIPYGHLANADLRRKRIFAHDCIRSMIRLRIMNKSRVYAWLSSCLGYRRKNTHISQMNDTMCDATINLTLNAIKNNNIDEYNRLIEKRNRLQQQHEQMQEIEHL